MKKFLTLFVLVCPLLALAQQTRQITGQVLDRADGAPLFAVRRRNPASHEPSSLSDDTNKIMVI